MDFDTRMEKLHWHTIVTNVNTDKVEYFDIFQDYKFYKRISELVKGKELTREKFKDKVKSACMYSFWAKCEYEVVISPLIQRGVYDCSIGFISNKFKVRANVFSDKKDAVYSCINSKKEDVQKLEHGNYKLKSCADDTSTKVDIWFQIKPNLDILVDYIIQNTNYRLAESV